MIPMDGGNLLHALESLFGLFRGPRKKSMIVPMIIGDLAVRKAESPYGIALDFDVDLGEVEQAMIQLGNQGVIRRSARQIIVPDDGEEIPRVYLRYELVRLPA